MLGSDFADQFPSAEVIGTDLSPIQPAFVPPNLRFEIDDCCSEWAYTKDSFDFIHVRGMYGSIADWPKFYEEVIEYAYLLPPTRRMCTVLITAYAQAPKTRWLL
jgi:hypothetical protein